MVEEFDFSEYSKDDPLYSRENMKTVGKLKDEFRYNWYTIEILGISKIKCCLTVGQ